MASKNLDDLFNDGLNDVYYAERKILTALPKMAASAETARLKEAFEKHHEETQGHVERLHQIFKLLGKPVKAKTCPAVDAIIEEGEEILDKFKESPALDLGLIAGAQTVEHYEIARYSALKKWGLALGYSEAVDLIDATLQEELKTDAHLGSLSDSLGNSKTFKTSR